MCYRGHQAVAESSNLGAKPTQQSPTFLHNNKHETYRHHRNPFIITSVDATISRSEVDTKPAVLLILSDSGRRHETERILAMDNMGARFLDAVSRRLEHDPLPGERSILAPYFAAVMETHKPY